MTNRTLDKRLQRLEATAEALEHETIYIYNLEVGLPEDVDSSYVVFLPDNGRETRHT